MRFAIATPVYNGMPALKQCVGSIRGQDADIERVHLIQDGGSSDGSREWLSKADGLSVEMKKDAGMYDAINQAWDRGDGEIYSWLNSDEQYLPGTLKTVRDYFTAHPEADIVFGNAMIVDPTGNPLAARREIPLRAWYVKNCFLYALSCATFFNGRLKKEGRLRLDTQYRVAGDIEMILRLLKEGAVCHHIPQYLSLFGVDGRNLSLSEGMAREGHAIQQKYGAYRHGAARKVVHAVRCLERVVRGCYRRDLVSYNFALDDQPVYHHFQNVPLGFRFTYTRALNKMNHKATV